MRSFPSLLLLANSFLLATNVFKTVDVITKYAQTHEEYPDIDNKDLLNPDYSSFHKNNLPLMRDKILRFFRLKSKPLWNGEEFSKLLDTVVLQRENNALIGRFAKKITPLPGSRFIIFGSLFGAFHSLERCLQYLKKEKIIDNNFRILDKRDYIIIHSDALGIAPYNLEIFTVILRLMKENPDNAIYIRGKLEDREYWLNYGLRDELEIRTAHISQEKPPLRTKINRFFNTLPLALYLTKKENGTNKAVRISYHDRTYEELDETKFPELFESDRPGEIKICNIKGKRPTGKNGVEIKTIIKSTNTFRVFLPKTGIAKTPPDKGSTSFVTFSSPTKSQRVVNKFFYDAFNIIDITKNFNDWTITLFRQDVREKLGIQKIAKFNLVSGELITPESELSQKFRKRIKKLERKIKALSIKQKKAPEEKIATEPTRKITKEISIGTTLDTTGEQANIGKKIKKVLNNYVNKVNVAGGINGNVLKFISLDDNNQPKLAKNNIETLIKNNTNIILSPLKVQPYLDIIKIGSVAVLFPNSAYAGLRDPKLKGIVNFGPGYKQIEQFAFSYVQKNIPAKKFAFFYQKKLAGESIPKIVKKLARDKYVTASYDPATLRIAKKAEKIKALKPDVLFIFGTPASATKLLNAIGAINLIKMTIVGYRLLSSEFKKFLEENNFTSRYIAIENLPDPLTSNLEIFKAMKKQNKEKNIDVFSAESYVATDIVVDALKKGAITKEEIINNIEKIKNYNLKGLELNFDPKTRQVSKYVWVTKGKGQAKKFAITATSS